MSGFGGGGHIGGFGGGGIARVEPARAPASIRRCVAPPQMLRQTRSMPAAATLTRGAVTTIMIKVAVIIAVSSSVPAIIAASMLISRTATPAGPMSTTTTVATIPIGMTDG
jgi:hypothetical protein